MTEEKMNREKKNIKINREGFSVNAAGNLTFDQCDLEVISKTYGTPCYVYAENIIRQRCREYKEAFSRNRVDHEILYASKAFLVKTMARILADEGMSLDVASAGEIAIALSGNFPPERIYFHGNNKSREEITYALEKGVGTLMVDNEAELATIAEIAKDLDIQAKVIIRVTPGIDTHTHKHIRTGQVDSKFGISIDKIPAFMAKVLSQKHLVYEGLHCHLGSQIYDLSPYTLAIEEMVKVIKKIKDLYGIETPKLDLGGGLGIKYLASDTPPTIAYFVDLLVKALRDEVEKQGIAMPKILIEPGRSIVGEAGITLYTIGTIKEIPGIKTYLLVDGGMPDNPRPILYDAKYEAAILGKPADAPTETVTIGGKCCESGDILIKNINLPKASKEDLLVIFSTGAYHHSMASNYNGLPKPAVVLVNKGQSGLMVKRETYADLVKNDRLPEWF